MLAPLLVDRFLRRCSILPNLDSIWSIFLSLGETRVLDSVLAESRDASHWMSDERDLLL